MTSHEQLVDRAKAEIWNIFSDDSVSNYQTQSSLEYLVEEIQVMIDSLNDDDITET